MAVSFMKAGRRGRPLDWTERIRGSARWWETAPDGVEERRAVVIWVPDLGQIVWTIVEDKGKRVLALGFVDSLQEPDDAVIEQAKRSAAQRWWEIWTWT